MITHHKTHEISVSLLNIGLYCLYLTLNSSYGKWFLGGILTGTFSMKSVRVAVNKIIVSFLLQPLLLNVYIHYDITLTPTLLALMMVMDHII